jgi:hypothetical protein
MLKKRGAFDFAYFLAVWMYLNFSIFLTSLNKQFEIGFTGHPVIINKRIKCINQVLYGYPQIVKNDIEYIHSKLVESQGVEQAKYSKDFTTAQGAYRFRIIVDEGKVFLKCLDPFEEIMEVNKSVLEEMELTEILDPYTFDNHRDVIDSFFTVYKDICELYVNDKDAGGLKGEKNELLEEAENSLKELYGIEIGTNSARGVKNV